MASSDSSFRALSQHESLAIRLVAPGFGHVSPEAAAPYAATHRLSYYFFLFLWEGAAEFKVDLETFAVEPQELVFALPNQVRQVPGPAAPAVLLFAQSAQSTKNTVYRPGGGPGPRYF